MRKMNSKSRQIKAYLANYSFPDIIHLIDEYGRDNYQKAIDIVSQKAVGNPKRTHSYVVGILKGQEIVP